MIRAVLFFIVAVSLFSLPVTNSNAQSGLNPSGLNSLDLTKVQSADVSDVQLRALILRAEQEGVSIDQAFELARARGLSSSVASKLRTRIRELQMQGDISLDEDELEEEGVYDMAREFIRPERVETEKMSRTFGAQIFQYRETEFNPTFNVATPVNYTLGPGDELIINVWGAQSNTHSLEVTPDGTVFVEGVGPIFVSGLTLEEANNQIEQSLEQIYSGLRGDENEQTTFVRVSINRLRTIQVSIIGEATNPGDYTIPSNSTVFNALYRAGGPAEDGSYRVVRVIRDNEKLAELDLYDFLVDGSQAENIRLRDRDVIQIPPYQHRVEVMGELKRSDLYFEVTEHETLSDLIHYAGGFTDNAYTRQIKIHRNTDTDKRIVTVAQNEFNDFEIKSGDVVFVDEILDRFDNRVSIEGAVWRAGEFELKEGMTLHDLIMEAEGVRPDAFLERGLINRMQDNFQLKQVSFSVSDVLDNPDRYDIQLNREDQVTIRSIHDMVDQQTVEIRGAIRQAGVYNYRESMSLEDLILKADGFNDSASESRIEISRRIMGDALPDNRGQQLAEIYTFEVSRNLSLNEDGRNFELQPYDQVFVHRRPNYQTQQTIKVEGEVMFPGTYTIEDRNERISDLIKRAGGLTNEAYIPGTRLIRKHSSIDRPDIEFDFLTSEEVIDEEQTGLVNEEANENTDEDEETKSSEEEMSIFEKRATINREDYLSEKSDSLQTSLNKKQAESRIGINLDEILKNPGSQDDLFLRNGDVLRVPQELQTVAITGAVMQDVEVRYKKGAKLGYYIDRAGGFATNARKKSVYVVYANGDVDRRKNYIFGLIKDSPSIEPGTHIIIPAKVEKPRMSSAQLVSISATVVGMTTSLIIAINQLSK